jgi:TatD DNase family protein
MIDIHAHLQFSDFDTDRDAVIARARAARVEKMIIVGTDIETSCAAIALAEKHDFLYASVGIHPHEYDESRFSIEDLRIRTEQLREMAKHPKVAAIGECGLDYFIRNPRPITDNRQQEPDTLRPTIGDSQKMVQREGFMAQLEIAREAGVPLIIHTRPSAGTMDAYEDMFSVLSDSKIVNRDSKFVLHCYQGDTDITRKFLSLPNVYFSFAGNVTYPVKKSLAGSKDDILETVKLVPLDRIFVETDCPYLAPQAHRGTRNEPAYVCLTATTVAEAKGITTDELDVAMSRSLRGVFLGERGDI